MTAPASETYQLRVLTGPLRGTVLPLRHRTGLGRAASSHLQLVDSNVSRQHAMIVVDDRGRHVLIDLASANGTFIDGRRVERHRLEPHTVFTIVGTEIVYEPTPQVPPSTAHPIFALPRTDGKTLRATVQFIPKGDDARPAPVDHPGAATGPEHAKATFEGPDGVELGGELLDHIVEYRRLRAQYLRGGLADPAQLRAFHALEDRLRQPPSAPHPASQRTFGRFSCWFPAALRLSTGGELQCWVRDLGVDGAQVRSEGHALSKDAIVWLALHLLVDGRSRSEVLTSRVVWAEGELLGLAFAGPPRSERGRYAGAPRLREELDDTRPLPHPSQLSIARTRR